MSDLEAFNYECLHAHNGLRSFHGAPPLEYNSNMAKSAQRYAEKIAAKDKLEHSKPDERDGAGENIAMSMRPFVDYSYSGLGATVSWYTEIQDYDFNKEAQNPNNPPTGHFTQVVWKDSIEAGFGRAMNPQNNFWYVVGRYQPAGNFVGQYKPNVLPLSKGLRWDEVPIVEEHLEELRTMEYTDARKHILDDWRMQMKSGSDMHGPYFEITETFTTPQGNTYTGTKSYSEDPRKKPRPAFSLEPDDILNGDSYETEDIFANEEFVDAVVKHHNSYRQKHGVGRLELDKKLCAYANDWAQQLVLEDQMNFSHYRYENSDIGENITSKLGKMDKQTAKELVDSWYGENVFYVYQKEPANFKNVGHFTQLVWKTSRSIGIGVAETLSGKSYVVCFYHPAGNVRNHFSEDVPKLKF